MSDISIRIGALPTVHTEPFFLQGSRGEVFCVRSTRENGDNSQNHPVVLFVPPFAEEMNRSRRFFTKLRHSLMASVVSEVVLPDLYGTGDSAGDFNDARWQIWKSDLSHIVNQLRAKDSNRLVSVVGVRAGCLLVDELANDLSVPFHNVVFVHPETSGYDVIQHLLRMRVASGRFSGGSTETTAELWRMFETGHSVEVGGYNISPHLVSVLKGKRLTMQPPISAATAHWIRLGDEVASAHRLLANGLAVELSSAYSVGSTTTTSTQVSSANQVHWKHLCLDFKPFWQLQEHEPEDALITAVSRCVVPAVR